MSSYTFDHRDTKQWITHLQTEGYAVLRDVWTPEDIHNATGLFWDFIETINPRVHRDDVATHTDENWPMEWNNGVVMEGEVQNTPFMWNARVHRTTREVFASLYDVSADELLVSFDRANAVRSQQTFGTPKTGWFHHDYPMPVERDFQCYQAFVNYIDCSDDGTPCLRVIPRSHRDIPQQQWDVKLADVGYTENDIVEVHAPAGSLVIWMCGLIHDNYVPISGDSSVDQPLKRLCAYVNYAPREAAIQEELRCRRECFEYNIATGHWPLSKIYKVDSRSRRRWRNRNGYPPLCNWEHDPEKLFELFGEETGRRLVG